MHGTLEMSGPPILDVRGLCVGIWSGKTELSAVADVSFRAYSGQVVALVGESGAGKSITAMSLTHLLPMPPIKITAGEIRLSGRDMQTQSPKQIRDIRGNEVGIVFQEPMTALNPSLRIWRQIAEPLVRHRRMSWSAAKAQAIYLLKKVRIPDAETKAEAYPHQLSGGMRQRVMVAIAISCEPRLIIADEPTTALDVTVQAQILTLLTDLTRGLGGALLLITHDLGVVARYADWVNVMYAGRIVGPIAHRLESIAGQPPAPSDGTGGCAFAPRCPRRTERCDERPPLSGDERTRNGHLFACWNPL